MQHTELIPHKDTDKGIHAKVLWLRVSTSRTRIAMATFSGGYIQCWLHSVPPTFSTGYIQRRLHSARVHPVRLHPVRLHSAHAGYIQCRLHSVQVTFSAGCIQLRLQSAQVHSTLATFSTGTSSAGYIQGRLHSGHHENCPSDCLDKLYKLSELCALVNKPSGASAGASNLKY